MLELQRDEAARRWNRGAAFRKTQPYLDLFGPLSFSSQASDLGTIEAAGPHFYHRIESQNEAKGPLGDAVVKAVRGVRTVSSRRTRGGRKRV